MKVLVAVATKHGATQEIARAIGDTLRERGLESDVERVEDVADLEPYTAVVLGSAVYVGQWREEAREFVDRHAAELAARPTWLFSSGPVGDPPKPAEEEAVQIGPILEATHARDHRLFSGRIDKGAIGFGERAMVRALRVPEGDFRDWDEIRRWAQAIATALGPDLEEVDR